MFVFYMIVCTKQCVNAYVLSTIMLHRIIIETYLYVITKYIYVHAKYIYLTILCMFIIYVACHDEKTARVAKSVGFQDVFYAKKRDTEGLTKTVMQAVDYAKALMIERSGSKPVTSSTSPLYNPK